MSKLSRHQIMAMIGKIEATIHSHEARPGSEANIRKLEASERKLEAYRAELAQREAGEKAAAEPAAAAPPAKQNDRLNTACPDCHAQPGEKCSNYKGQTCAPHRSRKPPRKVVEISPTTASGIRYQVDQELLTAVRRLAQWWTTGTIQEATWMVSSEQFQAQLAEQHARQKAAQA
ncbi:MAG TPA: hypothetical protein VKU01_23975 [Bryobacteraceae bacterium]|nr:hypothetical protein [Bryobacteraceae bacterium]